MPGRPEDPREGEEMGWEADEDLGTKARVQLTGFCEPGAWSQQAGARRPPGPPHSRF